MSKVMRMTEFGNLIDFLSSLGINVLLLLRNCLVLTQRIMDSEFYLCSSCGLPVRLFPCLLDASHNLTQLICVSLCCDIVLDAVPKVVNMNHTILSLLNLSPSWEKSILISNAKTDVLLGNIAASNSCNNLYIN